MIMIVGKSVASVCYRITELRLDARLRLGAKQTKNEGTM